MADIAQRRQAIEPSEVSQESRHPARFLAARRRGYRDAMNQPTRILLVADSADQTCATQQALTREDFEIVAARDFPEAYDRLLDSIFELIVIENTEPAGAT